MLLGGIFFHLITTQALSGGAGRRRYESTWGLPWAEEKGWAVFSTPAAQPVINDNMREKGSPKRLQFPEILLRETIATLYGSHLNEQTGLWRSLWSAFCYYRVRLSYDPITVQSIQAAPREALGTPCCAETSPFWCEFATVSASWTRNSHLGKNDTGMTEMIKAGNKHPSMIQNIWGRFAHL